MLYQVEKKLVIVSSQELHSHASILPCSFSPQKVEESSGDLPLVPPPAELWVDIQQDLLSQPYDFYLPPLTACFNSLLDLYSEDDMQHMSITCACYLLDHCWTLDYKMCF